MRGIDAAVLLDAAHASGVYASVTPAAWICRDASTIDVEIAHQARASAEKYHLAFDGHGVNPEQLARCEARRQLEEPFHRLLLVVIEKPSPYPLDPYPPAPAIYMQWWDVLAGLRHVETSGRSEVAGGASRLIWPMRVWAPLTFPKSIEAPLPGVGEHDEAQLRLA